MLTFSEYQKLAQKTANHSLPKEQRLAIAGLGLSGESGEVADIIKKAYGHGHPMDMVHLKDELGDVLWYLQELCEVAGLDLSEVAEYNINKLADRYPDGFSEWRSQNRSK